MTVIELVEKYPNDEERNEVIARMSNDELSKMIETIPVSEGKIGMVKKWERLTGNKYRK